MTICSYVLSFIITQYFVFFSDYWPWNDIWELKNISLNQSHHLNLSAMGVRFYTPFITARTGQMARCQFHFLFVTLNSVAKSSQPCFCSAVPMFQMCWRPKKKDSYQYEIMNWETADFSLIYFLFEVIVRERHHSLKIRDCSEYYFI